jgi:hypothetical protein
VQYFILKALGDDGDVFIDALPDGGPADWRFAEGKPLAKEFPESATVRFSDNFPNGRRLLDFVNNISDVLIVSTRVREVFDAINIRNVEYLPITILNHRGKVAPGNYFIANVLGSEPAIDMEKSDVVASNLDGEIATINNLVVDRESISSDAKLFRAATLKTLFFIREDALAALTARGVSGVKTFDADGWDGLEI